MKIEKLTLTNFRSHAETVLELDRLNVIRGLNGSGKSSIGIALEYLLTGKCDVTDKAGRGAQELISDGNAELGIQANFDGGAIVTRVRNQAGGNLIIGDGKQSFAGKVAESWVEMNLGPQPVLSAVSNAHRFLQMDAKEQKALLAGALAAEPVEIDPEMLTLHKTITAGFPMQPSVATAEEVDRLHKWHYDQRTAVNRDLKSLGEIVEPEIPDQMPTREEVTHQIDQLEKERTKLVQQRSQKIGEYVGRKDQLEAAKQQKKLFEADLLTNEQMTELEKQVKNRTKVAKLDKEIDDLAREIKAKAQAIVDWKNSPTTCDKCGAKLTVTQEQIDEKVKGLQDEMEALSSSFTAKVAERNKIADPELAKQKLDRHARTQRPYLRAEQTIKEIGDLGDAPDTTNEDEEIGSLTNRIQRGREIELQVAELEGKQKQYEQVKAKAETLKAQSAALDRLVEYFSDKGSLKAKLVGGRLPAFRDRMNQVLFRFGFYCLFEIEPYSIHVVSADNGNGRPKLLLNQLSESEQYRFGIAFSIALAEATGVGIVVIDRSDVLTADARHHLSEALLESNLEQAFVLCTGDPLDEYPDIDGVRFFELKNTGGVTTVEVAIPAGA